MLAGIRLFLLRHAQLVPIAGIAEEVGLEDVLSAQPRVGLTAPETGRYATAQRTAATVHGRT